MRADKIEPSMPPNPAPHILDRLIEIGLTEAGGMAAVPISWLSINEWQRAMHIRLPPWEAALMRKLSVEYLAEGRRAESRNCPAPWRTEMSAREQEVDLEKLRMVLG